MKTTETTTRNTTGSNFTHNPEGATVTVNGKACKITSILWIGGAERMALVYFQGLRGGMFTGEVGADMTKIYFAPASKDLEATKCKIAEVVGLAAVRARFTAAQA